MDIFKTLGTLLTGIFLAVSSLFQGGTVPTTSTAAAVTPATSPAQSSPTTAGALSQSTSDSISATTTGAVVSSGAVGSIVYTNAQLLAMAGNPYVKGEVPLGDYKYVTTAPKKGYVYLCNVHKDNPGSMVNGPWMHGTTWNFLSKVSVQGAVSWPQATFSNVISGVYRKLTGNDLPVGYKTGTFPVQTSDPAAAYDPNPNIISAQTLRVSVPANPTYSDTPYCMGGEVGIMTDGVALFDGFDAGLRDAPAHELQDSCDGHPQGSGEYHYHSLSGCFKDMSEEMILGYAYDGFPITGPEVAPNKFLVTDNLDECHGITSAINENGKQVVTYHYVMTQDFPYSASCFRGKPTTTGPSGGAPNTSISKSGASSNASAQGGQSNSQTAGQAPPQAAIDACSGKSVDDACSVTTPNGSINGSCRIPPNSSLACVPS
jgi:hypothetical protein